MDYEVLESALANNGGNKAAAARELGVARSTFCDWLNRKRPEPTLSKTRVFVGDIEPEVVSLRAENNKLRRALLKQANESGQLVRLVRKIKTIIPAVAPVAKEYSARSGDKPVVDACIQLSDIHYGAVQPEDEIEGFGEFSPAICEARLENFFQDFLDFVTVQRSGYIIKNLHVLCTGDYISGDIQDLRVTNAFPAPAQAVGCGVLLATLIAGLTPVFENTYVHIVTSDNHGRLTRKPQAKEGGVNNWSYVVGKWVEHSLRALPNVTVNVIAKAWESVECCGRRYLLTHGNHISGWERSVSRQAVNRMNAPDVSKFHRIVAGHWHTASVQPMYLGGGSVSGTDAFDHGQGRCSPPQQTTWLIHPEHGEFAWTAWNLRVC